MYGSINIFKRSNLNISWLDIFYGVKNNLFPIGEVSELAVYCLAHGDEREEIINLSITND